MNIFIKPINKITFEDVERFCQEKIGENIRIEYKEKFPENKKLAKEIASFANTHGGVILIGVAEKDRKPIYPVKGIEYKEGFYEKITSICLKNIDPPVFPEVQVCQKKDNPKIAVIVIRVEESDLAPHWVENGTKVYIRAQAQNEPILAHYEDIEWLRNRREKAIKNKNRLLERAEKRYTGHTEYKNPLFLHSLPVFLKIHIIPLFPSKILIEPLKIKELKFLQTQGLGHFYNYAHITLNEGLIFKYIIKYNGDNYRLSHMEINQYGLVWYKENLELEQGKILPFHILHNLYQVFLLGGKFYQEIGYWGILETELTLEGIQNKQVYIDERTKLRYLLPFKVEGPLDNNFKITKQLKPAELNENLDIITLEFYKEALWSLNASFLAKGTLLNEFLKEVKRDFPFP